MGLADRWYMQERGRLRQAWRRHRPPERVVSFEPVGVRNQGATRFWRWVRGVGLAIEVLVLSVAVVLVILWYWHIYRVGLAL